jgi:ABC-type dipeptide/oligopeptide/nickel transport system permease subunit
MSTEERTLVREPPPAPVAEPARPQPARRRSLPWAAAVAGVLAVGLGLRLWAIGHGLPFLFNIDERAHFVARTVAMYGGDRNPHDFLNPAALMYFFYVLLAVWFGGTHAAAHAYATDPTAVFTVARVAVALIGTLAVWLTYLAGARLFDRRVALLGAALMAVAFLPVFYSKQALNDVPAMAWVAFALWGSAGVLTRGRRLDYALAGLGIGLAAGTKYTGIVVLLALLAAAALRPRGQRRSAALGVALALGIAVVAFLVTNPYAILDHRHFLADLKAQNDYNSRGLLIGEVQRSGILYYLWTFAWGLGVAPALAAVAGAVVLLGTAVVAVLAPIVAPYPAEGLDLANTLQGPTPAHPFGTDAVGRDVFSRVLYGAGISLTIGLVSVGVGLLVGLPIGLVAGFRGGWLDILIMRVVDVLFAFPVIVLALMVIAVFGPGLYNAMLAIGLAQMPIYARLMRAMVLKVRVNDYVEAARALGASDARMLVRHVLPNAVAPLVVESTLQLATAILSAAYLGFLGLGAEPGTPEWGTMLADGRNFLQVAPHVTIFPGLAVVLLVLAFNLCGDGLRTALEPRLDRR